MILPVISYAALHVSPSSTLVPFLIIMRYTTGFPGDDDECLERDRSLRIKQSMECLTLSALRRCKVPVNLMLASSHCSNAIFHPSSHSNATSEHLMDGRVDVDITTLASWQVSFYKLKAHWPFPTCLDTLSAYEALVIFLVLFRFHIVQAGWSRWRVNTSVLHEDNGCEY